MGVENEAVTCRMIRGLPLIYVDSTSAKASLYNHKDIVTKISLTLNDGRAPHGRVGLRFRGVLYCNSDLVFAAHESKNVLIDVDYGAKVC